MSADAVIDALRGLSPGCGATAVSRIILTPRLRWDDGDEPLIRTLRIAFAPFGSLDHGAESSVPVASAIVSAARDLSGIVPLMDALCALVGTPEHARAVPSGWDVPGIIITPTSHAVGIITPTSGTQITLSRPGGYARRIEVRFPTPSVTRASAIVQAWAEDESVAEICAVLPWVAA